MKKIILGLGLLAMLSCTTEIDNTPKDSEILKSITWVNKQSYIDPVSGDTITADESTYQIGEYGHYYYDAVNDMHHMDIFGPVDDIHLETCEEAILTGWVDELNIDSDKTPKEVRERLVKAWIEFLEYDGFDPKDAE